MVGEITIDSTDVANVEGEADTLRPVQPALKGDLFSSYIAIESVEETDEDIRSPLLPERRPSSDLFVCDILDAAPKGDMASMEHPIFSLSTKPDFGVRRYEHGDRFVEVRPSTSGMATVHDRDILIYCISQAIASLNADPNKQITPVMRLKAHDLLTATNRVTDGRGYDGLVAALRRLQGTQIETNVLSGGKEVMDLFSLVDRAQVVRATRQGRMQEIEIRLSDWVMNAIRAKEVLTLHRDYFRLRKPLERRMYEIARKHCGKQREWKISLDLLQKKCGSNSTLKEFRRLVGVIVEQDQEHHHFPDYGLSLADDFVHFTNRQTMPALMREPPKPQQHLAIRPDTIAKAKKILPGYDIYSVEADWREWSRKKGPPENPDGAFLNFCKQFAKNNPI